MNNYDSNPFTKSKEAKYYCSGLNGKKIKTNLAKRH